MAWSTSELADLAGTTIKAVRHYHRVGLLDEPARAANGYKQYGTAHLVRLLQIRRLSELGVPLARIATLGAAEEDPDEAIDVLDAELAAGIERLQRARAELAILRKHRAPLDTPASFGSVSGDLSPRDRALVTVYSRVFDDDALEDLRQLASERDDYEDEFDALPEDAASATINELAERMAVAIRRDHARYPWMRDPGSASSRGKRFADSVIAPAAAELYNTAQLKVLARAHALTGENAPGAAQ